MRALPERVAEAVAWLEAAPLGMSRAEVATLWLSWPRVFATSADVLQHRLGLLVSRFFLDQADMRRVVCINPSLLARKSDALLSDFDSLLAAEPCLRAVMPSLLCSRAGLTCSTETLLVQDEISAKLRWAT